MRPCRALPFVLALAAAALAGPPALEASLAFRDRAGIQVLAAGAARPVRWSAGAGLADARLSPDGRVLAATLDTSREGGPVRRAIALLAGPGARPAALPGIPGDNAYGPIWSPDGARILFRHLGADGWRPAVVARDGSGFRRHGTGGPPSDFLEPAWWAADGASFFAYDFTRVVEFGLDGRERSSRPVAEVLGDAELSTGLAFSLSPDGRRLLFSAPKPVADLRPREGPPLVLFLRDLERGTLVRVSPPGMQADAPVWLPDGRAFLFTGWRGGPRSLYRAGPDGAAPVLLRRDAAEPSLGR